MILNRAIITAGFVAEGASNPTLAEPGCPCDEEVLIAVDPVADDEFGEDRLADHNTFAEYLAGVRQAAVHRSRAGVAILVTLYASRCHLQSSAGLLR